MQIPLINKAAILKTGILGILVTLLCSCGVTSRIEPYKQTNSVIGADDQLVVLARKHHTNYEAESGIIECISDGLANGNEALNVHPSVEFEDKLYPWFEPSTAPLDTEDLSELLERPGVAGRIEETGVRFVVWLDGSTERVASGGGIS